MNPISEKRLLQTAVVAGGAFSLLFAAQSLVSGVGVLHLDPRSNVDLDSHFRYLSGIFLGALVAVYSCVASIERKGRRFRLLGALIVCGGLGRLASLFVAGVPGQGHQYGLAMELLVTPLLVLWQARVASRMGVAVTASADDE